MALSRGRHAVLRVVGETCPATNPTPLSARGTGGFEARTPLPSGVLTAQRQYEGMRQPLPPVMATSSHVIDLLPWTFIAPGCLTMRANPALSSSNF